MTKSTTTPATLASVTLPGAADQRVCGCGCEANIAGRALYRPGHDARHAGQVARAIAGAKAPVEEAARLLPTLPSLALQTKARDHAIRLIAKAEAKATKDAEK